MITVLLIVAVGILIFVGGVCESNRVIAAVKAGQTDLHTALSDAAAVIHQETAAVHDRVKSLESITATRITAVEDSIKAKLP